MKKCIIIAILAVISVHSSSFAQVNHPKKEVKVEAKDNRKTLKDDPKPQKPGKKDTKIGTVVNKGMNKGLQKGTHLYVRSVWNDIY